MSFNKWQWVRECDEEIASELKKGNLTNEEECWDFVFEMIGNATIYSYDCFNIIQELNFTDFKGCDFEITNIYEAAFAALQEWALEQVSIENLVSNV